MQQSSGEEGADAALLLSTTADGIAAGQIDLIIDLMMGALRERPPEQDPFAQPLVLLLEHLRDRVAALPPLHDVPRLPIHFDDDFAQSFADMVALLRRQDAQIAALGEIASELL